MPSYTLPKNLSLCFSIIKRPRLAAAVTATTSDDENRRSSSYASKPAPDDDDDADASRESTPDLATAYASHRFFFSSPGRSNSIVNSSSASSTSEPEPDSDTCSAPDSGTCPAPDSGTCPAPDSGTCPAPDSGTCPEPDSGTCPAPDSGTCPEPDSGTCPAPDSGVAVDTYSPDPYADFRRSMEEMVEARGLHDVRESWDGLHQLLLRYLSLNPKPTHQFIVAAFSDLLVSLMPLHQPPTRDGSHVGSCRCSSH